MTFEIVRQSDGNRRRNSEVKIKERGEQERSV